MHYVTSTVIFKSKTSETNSVPLSRRIWNCSGDRTARHSSSDLSTDNPFVAIASTIDITHVVIVTCEGTFIYQEGHMHLPLNLNLKWIWHKFCSTFSFTFIYCTTFYLLAGFSFLFFSFFKISKERKKKEDISGSWEYFSYLSYKIKGIFSAKC